MRMIGAMILGCALMVGSADAGECTSRCTPVRTVVSNVVSAQVVRSTVFRVRAVRPLQRLLNRVRRCCQSLYLAGFRASYYLFSIQLVIQLDKRSPDVIIGTTWCGGSVIQANLIYSPPQVQLLPALLGGLAILHRKVTEYLGRKLDKVSES